jgi:hypothetical protein
MEKCTVCGKKYKPGTGIAVHMRSHSNGAHANGKPPVKEDTELVAIGRILAAFHALETGAKDYVRARLDVE